MQQLSMFRKIFASIYQLGTDPVYAYIPDEEHRIGNEAEAKELYRRGAVFVYLRYPVGSFDKELILIVESVYGKATVLYVDNQGEYINNWESWDWYAEDVKYRQSRLLSLHGYDVLIPQNTLLKVGEDGIHFQSARFGKGRTEECREVVLLWNGQCRLLLQAGSIFWKEAQIRYVGEINDSRGRKGKSFVHLTGEPKWDGEDRTDGNGQSAKRDSEDNTNIEVEVHLCWSARQETSFVLPENILLYFTAYPAIKMESCILRFAKGIGEYYLVMSGKGIFLDSAEVAVGSKGFFRISKGDKVELAIVPEGYIGKRELSVDVSALRISAPFYVSGMEWEVDHAVPVFPVEDSVIGKFVRRRLERKMQENGQPAYHKDPWFGSGIFASCVFGQNILWYNLYAAKESFPGISLCHVDRRLACALVADESFVVLDYHAISLFTMPYTIDSKRINEAGQMGYPQDSCNELAKCYPAGQTFLEESAFRQGVEQAGCPYTEQIRASCHHYRISVGDRDVSFPTETWQEQGIILVIKKGRNYSVSELAEDAETWSFPSEDIEAEQMLLKKICEEKRETAWETVVVSPEWEGSMVVCTGNRQDGWMWLLALQAKTGEVVFEDSSEKTVLVQK